MKKYVINMLAKPNQITTSQMASISSVDKAMEIYLKNSLVSLASVKIYNPEIECVLFVNFKLPEKWKQLFSKFSIQISFVEFGGFKIDSSFNWGIVQYRYDVMQYLSQKLSDEDCVIMLDTDVVCVGTLCDVFEEIKHRIVLFDVQNTYSNNDRAKIFRNYCKLYPDETHCELVHWGGEFIGANGYYLRCLFNECKSVMEKTRNTKELEDLNDEHITSIAVYRNWNKIPVNNANPYIYRYWTGLKFCLTSTNWFHNKVVLWHVPAEKSAGMLWLYKHLLKKNKLPKDSKIAHRFGFPKPYRKNILPFLLANLNKVKKEIFK